MTRQLTYRLPARSEPTRPGHAWRHAMSLNPKPFATARAHELLAELIQAGAVLDGQIVGTAQSEDAGLQVVIFISGYEPLRVVGPLPAALVAAAKEPALTPTQKRLVALLDGARPRKAEWIAAKLGKKSSSGSFYGMLSELQRLGAIRRVSGGGYVLM